MSDLSALLMGGACGLLYSSILITLVCVTVFNLYKNNNELVKSIFESRNPSKIVFTFIILLKPFLALMGIGFTYLLHLTRVNQGDLYLWDLTITYVLSVFAVALIIQGIQSFLLPLGKFFAMTNIALFICVYGLLIPMVAN